MALDNILEANSDLLRTQGKGVSRFLQDRERLVQDTLQAFRIPGFDFKNILPKGIIRPIDVFEIPQELELGTAYGMVTHRGNFLLYKPPLDCGCDCPSPEFIEYYNDRPLRYIQ